MLKFFRIPFANGGDRSVIPDPTDPNGFVSFEQGYGFDYERQKTDPASKNIERDGMNGLFFDVTTAIAELQSAGVPDFITTALNGGTAYSYGVNALCRYNDEIYISRKTANTSLPSVAADWFKVRLATPRAVAGGTVDAITADFVPNLGTLQDGDVIMIQHAGTNITTTPTINPDGTGALSIYKGSNGALSAGDIAGADFWGFYVWDSSLSKLQMLNPAKGLASPDAQLQSISSSVAANALTVNLVATTWDFRSATLSNGSPISGVQIPARSIVIPSGATLGAISGQSTTLVFLTAYNGGAPVECVVNLAGGVNLDESNLISPTTISAGATANNVIYSASAVSANSPYRVDGYLVISEATAGQWATDATIKQGFGGQALSAMATFGFGQTEQNVIGSRSVGTSYTNLTNRTIWVSIPGTLAAGGGATLAINGVGVCTFGSASTLTCTLVAPVGPGKSYSVAGAFTPTSWIEMR